MEEDQLAAYVASLEEDKSEAYAHAAQALRHVEDLEAELAVQQRANQQLEHQLELTALTHAAGMRLVLLAPMAGSESTRVSEMSISVALIPMEWTVTV